VSDDQRSWPILSVNEINQQKSVICHATITRFCHLIKSTDYVAQDRTHVLFSTTKMPKFFYTSQQILFVLSWQSVPVQDEYLFQLFYSVCYYYSSLNAKNNASIILESAFCCCVFVK